MDASKIATIQALLAKAEGNTNAAEAEAYQAKAEKLMVKYGIEDAMLAARPDAGTVEMAEREVEISGIYAKGGLVQGFAAALSALGTVIVLQAPSIKSKSGMRLFVIGAKTDVDQAVMMIQSLQVQANHALASWWKGTGKEMYSFMGSMDQFKCKREFMRSFGYGVATRITENKNEVVSSTVGAEIALVSRKDKAQAYQEELYPHTRTVRDRTHRGSLGASMAGREAGRNANYRNDHSLGGTRGVLNG